ncbi:NAD(P)/FAD-dependent oxidoreductase [Telluribacter sp. SYSU D00476]|uniref:flavin-containing monooxygenase n=1 Tax=Telluribacter sp. SYSU D00476 TaxID=2811430 RepID=UPI001FF2B813|nr:NAD(P)/FAD-dependent oxidoreductase [Telluribacter sp. SYSU D00476]
MDQEYQVGIVGAGFAGLVAALRLRKAGRDSFVIFERASEVGGTWRDNRYPGCACDIPSPLYSFSTEPNPEWSQLYSGQPEIFEYLKGVVSKNSLKGHIRYNTEIVDARFAKEEGYWVVKDQKGLATNVRVLLLAVGPLNRPHIPRFAGLDDYKGTWFHSSEWKTHYDLTGKRVAVIGTGASAIQIVPAIAPSVGQLTVFQRTPAWITSRFDRPMGPKSKALFRRFPLMQRMQREFFYWLNELFGLGFVGNKSINRLMTWAALRKLSKEVKDPDTRRRLTPSYTIGCKRILKSDDYYQTFNLPHVSLVTEEITCFTDGGILTRDGQEHVLDAVIFGTGFVAADIEMETRITGLTDQNLIDLWRRTGAEAYLGTTVAGYPNLAFVLGPNTGLGHNSVVHMMESQMNYIMQYIEYLEASGPGSYLDIRPQAQQAYNQEIQERLKGTVWSSGCKSWYLNTKGKNTTLYPGLTVRFRKETRRFNPEVYELVKQEEPAVSDR